MSVYFRVGSKEYRCAENVAAAVSNKMQWNVYFTETHGVIQFNAIGKLGVAHLPVDLFDGRETEERLTYAVAAILKSTDYRRGRITA